MLDNFLPEQWLSGVLEGMRLPSTFVQPQDSYGRAQENLKQAYNPDMGLHHPFLTQLFYAFNSAPFLRWLEGLTGIGGLLPDPYFHGGGVHITPTGGHLFIHADFNIHKHLSLLRRLNLLVFLNEEWQEEWGGHLELWSADMQHCERKILPRLNRAVLFDTTDRSFHGQPDPLRCPPSVRRLSLALYYYTASAHIFQEHRSHTTQFQVRPGSGDQVDWNVKVREWVEDWLPPILRRKLASWRRKPSAGGYGHSSTEPLDTDSSSAVSS